MAAKYEGLASLYQDLAQIPEFSAGYFVPTGATLISQQRDIEGNAMRSFQTSFLEHKGEFFPAGFPTDLVNVNQISFSPSGKKMAVIRGSDNDFKLEIWDGTHITHIIQLEGKHGFVYNDGWFQGFTWSPDEDSVVYVAEAKTKAGSTYFQSTAETERGTKFEYKEDWGETYTGKSQPVLVRVKLSDRSVNIISGIPSGCSAGQPVYTADGKSVLFVGWRNEPRLGVKYCYNRPAALYRVSVEHDVGAEKLTPSEDWAVRSPRVHGHHVYYISVPKVGTHNSTARLRVLDLTSSGVGLPESARTLIDISDLVSDVAHDVTGRIDLPGLYCELLPRRCFASNNSIVFNSQYSTHGLVISLDLTTGVTSQIAVPRLGDLPGSAVVLDVHGDRVLCSVSTPTVPQQAWIYTISSQSWTLLSTSALTHQAQSALHALTWEVFHVDGRDVACEGIVIRKKNDEADPLLFIPHGGPHSAFASTWMMSAIFLASCGRTIVLANYTGSTGYGQRTIDALPGNIGKADVEDCIALADYVAQRLYISGPYTVCGGSHGGFLGGHLIGQYPEKFKAAILRNPVTNLCGMANSSDIPDWADVEGGLAEYTPVKAPNFSVTLFEASPIRYISSVKAPVMLMVGTKDRRVPPAQSMEYYRALQSINVECKMFVYPDCPHAISMPASEADAWINGVLWLNKHAPAQHNE